MAQDTTKVFVERPAHGTIRSQAADIGAAGDLLHSLVHEYFDEAISGGVGVRRTPRGGARCWPTIERRTAASCTRSRSTGIYCRPSCPSRRPRRDRVLFFDDTEAARAAGFRACKRCKPDAAAAADPWIDKIRRACVYLSNVDGHPSLRDAGRAPGRQPVSPAAQLQAARRRLAARVRGRHPSAQGEGTPAPGRRHYRRDVRRRIRFEQPLLRARGAEARDGAVDLSSRRRRHADRLCDRRRGQRVAGTIARRRDARAASAPS